MTELAMLARPRSAGIVVLADQPSLALVVGFEHPHGQLRWPQQKHEQAQKEHHHAVRAPWCVGKGI